MISSELISIVVPVYKTEAYLNRCVQSIINQTYKNTEIILVDDGSPDDCPRLCDCWAQTDKRIKVIHKSNGGLSDARNAGVKVSNGTFLAFVDGDDYLSEGMLENLIMALNQDDSDIAACTVAMVNEDGVQQQLLTVRANVLLNREEAQYALLKESFLKQPVWYKLYKRALVSDIPFEVGKSHEDVFWSYQAIGRANRVSVIDYIGYFYVQRSDSIMGQGYTLKRLDAAEAVEKRYTYIQREFPALEREARLKILSSCIYHGQMALKYLDKNDRKTAFRYLKQMKNRYKFAYSDYAGRKAVHRLWFDIGRFSLPMVCWIKNMLHTGL